MSIVPIFDPDRPFRLWAMSEVYKHSAQGSYVPNVNDGVWDWDDGLYRVLSVDIETGISQLERYRAISENEALTPDDILLGAVPARVSEAYRLYINDHFDPICAAVDSRLIIYGSDNHYIRLFKGFEIGNQGKVISAYYDKNNELKDDKIPLELVQSVDENNRCIKTPAIGYITKGLPDGEAVTAVVYSNTGSVTSINPLLVKNVSFVRRASEFNKYITKITIQSPYLVGNSDRLEVPLHTPLSDLAIGVVLHYSSGQMRKIVANDPHISISGLEVFKVSQKNQTIPVVITYRFGERESNYNASSDDGSSMSVVYQLTTMPPLSAGVIKLYALPMWSDVLNGWALDYYMFNQDGSENKRVTDSVNVVRSDSQPYSPNEYDTTQSLTLTMHVDQVSSIYVDYTHNQTIDVTLLSPRGQYIPSWSIAYSNDGDIVYGLNQLAKVSVNESLSYIDISQKITDCNTWLDVMYLSVYPIVTGVNHRVILPTHVKLHYKDEFVMIAVSEYYSPIVFPSELLSGDTLLLEWIYRSESNDLYLAITPITIEF